MSEQENDKFFKIIEPVVKIKTTSGRILEGKVMAHFKNKELGHCLLITHVKPRKPEF